MPKIATCCYCGNRAALVLEGEGRHDLTCAACGAPLSNLTHATGSEAGGKSEKKKKKKEKKKEKSRSVWKEAFDIIEDIFD